MDSTLIPVNLLEIHQANRPGFQPVIDFAAWRVGFLNFSSDLVPERITELQRHDESDELFILLSGDCVLIVGEGDESVKQLYVQKMDPFKIYDIKCGVWHSHVLSEDAKVLIVENENTSPLNSPRIRLTAGQRAQLLRLTRKALSLEEEPSAK